MNETAILQQENEALKETLEAKNDYIRQLETLIKHARQQAFGASSEKVSPEQIGLFNEAESLVAATDEPDPTVATLPSKRHSSQSKPRISIPAHLPREDVVYDLPDHDKICPHDGTALTQIGSEDHEQLDIIPAQIKVIRHRRLTYACPCCEQHIVTANKPTQAIEKSIASPGLLAYVATQKYADALPLYRQSTIFARLGIHLSRQNLANWMIRTGQLVQPLINLLQDHVLDQGVVHMDETTVQVLDEPDRAAQSKSYLWLLASFGERPASVFSYHASRSQSIPCQQLSSPVTALMVDGYVGYEKACQDHGITRLGCWAHARRKFMDAKKLQAKGKVGKPDQALAFIQKLYQVERQIQDQPPDKRYQKRQHASLPILNKIRAWLDKSLGQIAPKTKLGEALVYLSRQWSRLTRYIDDGRYPIDNNLAENAIRPFAIGRKNWLFCKSQAGAHASANLYSLIQTAKANQLNPDEYLRKVFAELPNATSVEAVEQLLPWNIQLG